MVSKSMVSVQHMEGLEKSEHRDILIVVWTTKGNVVRTVFVYDCDVSVAAGPHTIVDEIDIVSFYVWH